MMERALRNAVHKGQLSRHVDARRAALGLHAYVDGLIYDWLLDPDSFALGREAEALLDQYLDGLRGAPASDTASAPRSALMLAPIGGSPLQALERANRGRSALAKPQR
jgi:hypothetical protein